MRQLVITEKSDPRDIADWIDSGTREQVVVSTDERPPNVETCLQLARESGLPFRETEH